ncbi:MAG: HlyD family efflux transporter periplasmic adaptor subunit [Saprospiraceae bacterium]
MDKDIDPRIIKQQRRKRIWFFLLLLLVVIAALWGLRRVLSTQVDAGRLRTATAEIGRIDNTLNASGEVIPAFEQVITAPIRAEVREVLVSVGSQVDIGTPILALDKSFTELEYEKLKQELELKRNSITKLRFQLEKTLFDLQITDSIKALRINQLQAELDNSIRLESIGGGTKESVDKAGLDLKIAKLEKQQLENDLRLQEKSTITDLRELEIQSNIQSNAIREMEEKLKRADIVAKRPGVLTWVNENIGSTVSEGESLARIADLKSYKVLGTCSDLYAERLRVGMAVLIRLTDEDKVQGSISNIRPSVENNVITFDIQLEESNHPMLRPNQRVEVFIVTASKSNIVRVANGPAFKDLAQQYVFVLKDGMAERRRVNVGMTNFDFVEIEGGIEVGEEVIISDMTRYEHLEVVEVK